MRLLESESGWRTVHELAGPARMRYREMLATYRSAATAAPALWLPLPLALMNLAALTAEALPQRVYSRDTLYLLERGSVAVDNATPRLLGRAPTSLARGLAIAPARAAAVPQAMLSPGLAAALRATLAFMWIHTAFVSALWPQRSGVLALLARCGFEGEAGVAVLAASCVLNTALGAWVLLRPEPPVFALQAAAVLGYTTMAAWHMPELTLDHCGPLVKNLPVLGLVLLLWIAQPAPQRETSGLRHTRPDAARAVAVPRA